MTAVTTLNNCECDETLVTLTEKFEDAQILHEVKIHVNIVILI